MSKWKETLERISELPGLLYCYLNPKYLFLNSFSKGIGDSIMLSALIPGLKKKYPGKKIVVQTPHKSLFYGNPDVAYVARKHLMTTKRHFKTGYHVTPHTDSTLLAQMAERIGIEPVDLTPRIYLTEQELTDATIELPETYLTICPEGKMGFTQNRKEWGFEKFVELTKLLPDMPFVQIGDKRSPLLPDAIDRRGTALRTSAAIVQRSACFVGLEGGLMHLARATETRAAIIYGGLIRPAVSSYADQLTISCTPHCSPCFISKGTLETCDNHVCMESIDAGTVADLIRRYLNNELDDLRVTLPVVE